jgi:hypothetical protein
MKQKKQLANTHKKLYAEMTCKIDEAMIKMKKQAWHTKKRRKYLSSMHRFL